MRGNIHLATELFNLTIHCNTAPQRQIAVGLPAGFPLALPNRITRRNERFFGPFAAHCSNLQFRHVFILAII